MLHQRIDLPLLVSSLLLLGVGSVMVYSASSVVAEEMFSGDSGFFVKRYLVRLILGIVILVLFASLDYQKQKKWSPVWMAMGLVFLILVFVPGLGMTIRGATRTLNLFSMTIQPAEGIKIALIVYLAYLLEKNQNVIDRFVIGLLPGLAVVGATCLLIVLQPDYGTAIVLAVTSFAMLYVGRARLLHLAGAGAVMLPVLLLKLYTTSHSRHRLMAYFDRFFGSSVEQTVNLQGADYQLQQALIGLGTGGIFGIGLGQSQAEIPVPTRSAHGFRIRGDRRRTRVSGIVGGAGTLCRFRLEGDPHRPHGARRLWFFPGIGTDHPHLAARCREHRRGDGPAAHHRPAASFSELRRFMAAVLHDEHRDPAEYIEDDLPQTETSV